MTLYSKFRLNAIITGIFCLILCCGLNSWSQQTDSVKVNWRTLTRKASRLPEIKANIQPYQPFFSSISGYNFLTGYGNMTKQTPTNTVKDKLLTILKIYPNPVEDQLNVVFAVAKENTEVTIKILDLLGNEVVTLSNEKFGVGEQTKTFTIPTRMKAGVYFLRIAAGSEVQVKRISVL